MKFELWQNADKSSVTLIPAGSEQHRRLIEPDATLIWTVEADSFEAALAAQHEYLGWEPYKPWRPHRYQIAVWTSGGQVFFYPVTTWLGERKAIAVAAIEHHRRHPTDSEAGYGLNDVMVKDLGAIDAATDEEIVQVPEGDLFDKGEGLSRSQP
jgi:hypothetical protein